MIIHVLYKDFVSSLKKNLILIFIRLEILQFSCTFVCFRTV
jgi:hypothetical protein